LGATSGTASQVCLRLLALETAAKLWGSRATSLYENETYRIRDSSGPTALDCVLEVVGRCR
jgi:hypothetical protein